MWLPKTERILLRYFYENIDYTEEGEIDFISLPARYDLDSTKKDCAELLKMFESQSTKDDLDSNKKSFAKLSKMLESQSAKRETLAALIRLIERGLIISDDNRLDQKGIKHLIRIFFDRECKLTIKGWDLAHKLNNPFTWIGLWVSEHRDCGVGFFLGLIGGLVTTIIIELAKNNPN